MQALPQDAAPPGCRTTQHLRMRSQAEIGILSFAISYRICLAVVLYATPRSTYLAGTWIYLPVVREPVAARRCRREIPERPR